MPSLFSKIVTGEIPSHKIYEDDLTLAFLDIHPKTEGHTLVIPKVAVDEFQDLSDEDYKALMGTVKKIAKRLKEIYPSKRVGLQVIGVDVPHAHIHVFPFADLDEYRTKQDMNAEPDHDQLAAVAKKLAF
jgi:histidine triad (HIT) family protein